jgi:hypothetical protein
MKGFVVRKCDKRVRAGKHEHGSCREGYEVKRIF